MSEGLLSLKMLKKKSASISRMAARKKYIALGMDFIPYIEYKNYTKK